MSEPSINFEVFFPVLVLFPILIFVFSKIYKWTNWKEKLIGNKLDLQPEENAHFNQ